MSADFQTRVAAVCRPLPEAELSDPSGGGHGAWKAGGRMFALIGTVTEGIAIKCPDIETAGMLKDARVAHDARYLHKSWVRLPEDSGPGELEHRLVAFCELIRAKLPASERRKLAPRAGE